MLAGYLPILIKKIQEVENKIPDVSRSTSNAGLNTKIGEVENKIPNHSIYIITSNFNKFTSSILDEKLKEAKLATIKILILLSNMLIKKYKNYKRFCLVKITLMMMNHKII